jgi:hypothetical protein
MRSLRTLCRRFARDERGSVLPLVGLCMMVIIGLAVVVIDLGQEHALRTQLQATADSAALAAASELPNRKKARARALEYAEKNMPPEDNGTVLMDEDIVFGTWYEGSHRFSVNGKFTNAVQVTVRRARQNGNPSPTFFLHLFGYDHADIAAESLAGIVVMGNLPSGGTGELDEETLARLQEMEDALNEEQQYRRKKSSSRRGDRMDDKEVGEFLMENYGHPALLR